MKKVFYLMFCLLAMAVTLPVMTSCDPEDKDEYYAGESEEDYKPNSYTVSFNWDLSGVSDLTNDQKQATKKELDKLSFTKTYSSRKDAVADFDQLVEEIKLDKDMAKWNGLKCTMKLTRGTAIIKKADLRW